MLPSNIRNVILVQEGMVFSSFIINKLKIDKLVAIQFARIEMVSRSSGGNSCLKAAYNARVRVKDSRANRTFDFSNRGDNAYHEVLLPSHANKAYKDPELLMNLVESHEKRKDSQVLKDIVIALPDDREIILEDRIEITKRIIDHMGYVREGLAVQLDIHSPHDGDHNWHAHLLVTTRRFREDGEALEAKKATDLNPEFYKSSGKAFAIPENRIIGQISRDIQNEYFIEKGLALRVDPTADLGSIHIGPRRMRSAENKNISKNEVIHEANLEILKDGDSVLDRVTSTKSVFSEYELKRAVKHMIDSSVRFSLVKEAMASSRMIPLYLADGTKTDFFTTKEVRVEEQRVLYRAGLLNSTVEVKQFAFKDIENLSDHQRDALEFLTSKKDGALKILKGRAGTGKSTVLSKLASKEITALAPTHKASIELKEKGFENSFTIDSFLWKARVGKADLENINTIIIDEAAMVSTPTYRELLKLLDKIDCSLILAGDERQLSSISRGGMFEVLADKFGSFELTEVHRQKSEKHRHAAELMAKSQVMKALKIFEEDVHFSNTDYDSKMKLIGHWENSPFDLQKRQILAIANKDVDHLNEMARHRLKQAGKLGKDDWQIGYQKLPFAEGDRIVFTKTNRSIGVYNSEFGRILEIKSNGDATDTNRFVSIRVKIDDGREVEFNPYYFHHIKHGYASTVYKSQGASLGCVFVLHSGFSTINNSYVQMTRHVIGLKIYADTSKTPDIEALTAQLSAPQNNAASLSYFTHEDLTQKKGRFSDLKFKLKMYWNDNINSDENYYRFIEDTLDRRQVFKVAKLSGWEDNIEHFSDKSTKSSNHLDFARIKRDAAFAAEKIALSILGAPNEILSNGSMLRYGENGKIIVTTSGPKSGLWYDHSTGKGGDMLSFVSEHKEIGIKESAIYLKQMTKDSGADISHDISAFKDKLKLDVAAIDNKKAKTNRSRQLYNRGSSIEIKEEHNFSRASGYNLNNSSPYQTLRSLAFKPQYTKDIPYSKLEKELHIIKENGYARDFLIAHDIKNFCQFNNISYLLRGSANSSIAAKALGLHNNDIERQGLMQERFLSPDNRPDFDFDIDSRHRDLVEKYILNKYSGGRVLDKNGEPHICSIGIGGVVNKGLIKEPEHKLDLLSSNHLAKTDMMMRQAGISALPHHDQKTFELISSGNVAGVFQLGSSGKYCQKLQPRSMEDLVNLSAAIRPGARDQIEILSGGVKSHLPDPKGVFTNTKGAILFQEQIMKAGKEYFSSKEPNNFRKELHNINKLQESLKSPQKQLDTKKFEIRQEIGDRRGAIMQGCSIAGGGKLLTKMISASSYVYNKAHATAYAGEIYKSAYLKANHKEVWDKYNNLKAKDIKPNLVAQAASVYLANHRGITCGLSDDIKATTVVHIGQRCPALVCFARDGNNNITGHQGIILNAFTAEKETKRSYGQIKGAFVSAGESLSSNKTIIAEGLETALSIKEAGLDANIKCSLGISNIKNYQPKENEHIILALDNDGDSKTISKIIETTIEAIEKAGAKISVVMPEKANTDFNDMLKEEGAEKIQELFLEKVDGLKILDEKTLQLERQTMLDLEKAQETSTVLKEFFTIENKKHELLGENREIPLAELRESYKVSCFVKEANKLEDTELLTALMDKKDNLTQKETINIALDIAQKSIDKGPTPDWDNQGYEKELSKLFKEIDVKDPEKSYDKYLSLRYGLSRDQYKEKLDDLTKRIPTQIHADERVRTYFAENILDHNLTKGTPITSEMIDGFIASAAKELGMVHAVQISAKIFTDEQRQMAIKDISEKAYSYELFKPERVEKYRQESLKKYGCDRFGINKRFDPHLEHLARLEARRMMEHDRDNHHQHHEHMNVGHNMLHDHDPRDIIGKYTQLAQHHDHHLLEKGLQHHHEQAQEISHGHHFGLGKGV